MSQEHCDWNIMYRTTCSLCKNKGTNTCCIGETNRWQPQRVIEQSLTRRNRPIQTKILTLLVPTTMRILRDLGPVQHRYRVWRNWDEPYMANLARLVSCVLEGSESDWPLDYLNELIRKMCTISPFPWNIHKQIRHCPNGYLSTVILITMAPTKTSFMSEIWTMDMLNFATISLSSSELCLFEPETDMTWP